MEIIGRVYRIPQIFSDEDKMIGKPAVDELVEALRKKGYEHRGVIGFGKK